MGPAEMCSSEYNLLPKAPTDEVGNPPGDESTFLIMNTKIKCRSGSDRAFLQQKQALSNTAIAGHFVHFVQNSIIPHFSTQIKKYERYENIPTS